MIVHVWSRFTPKHEDTIRRQTLAQSTWTDQRWIERGLTDSALARRFAENGKTLPYIRDLFDTGSFGLDDSDIVVFSNADIGFRSDAAFRIAIALQRNDAGYANRRDFPRLDSVPPDSTIASGQDYCGTDVFFFRVGWWMENRKTMPDLLLAREAWDACLRVLMEATNPNKPLSIENLAFHERHGGAGHWETPTNRYRLAGQVHNLKLAKAFVVRYGHKPGAFGIR